MFSSIFNYTLYFDKDLLIKCIYELNNKYNFLNLENIKKDNIKLLSFELSNKYINFFNIPIKYITFYNFSFFLIILNEIRKKDKRIIIQYLNYINDNNFI